MNSSSLMKQIDVVLAEKSSDSFKLVKRGILPVRNTGVSKFMNVHVHWKHVDLSVESNLNNKTGAFI